MERERRMQDHAPYAAAFADGPVSIGFGSPPANEQFTGVLRHNNLAAANA